MAKKTIGKTQKQIHEAERRKNKRKRAFRKAMDRTSAALVLVLFAGAVGYPLVTGAKNVEPLSDINIAAISNSNPDSPQGSGLSGEALEEPTEPLYNTITVNNDEVYKGELILVNADHPFINNNSTEITTLFDEKTDSYSVSGMDISMQSAAIEPLNNMLDAFYTETGHNEILIVDGFRTLEKQQQLYDADLEATGLETSTLVALPGHSEHESGYALDFSLFYNDGTSGEYDGTGDYTWIDENCAEYGYILRYPADKTELTKIQYESWHYRYVGKPHAYYIMESKICLEEYMEKLKSCTIESPLEIVDSDGSAYAVYYVPADTENSVTYVPLLSEYPYTISGNNSDGFIITADLQEKRELVSYTKPIEEITGITTDEYGNVVTSLTTDNTAETTTTTIVYAVG